MTRQRVQQIANNFSVKEICNEYENNKPIEKITEIVDVSQGGISQNINKFSAKLSNIFTYPT
ncbi:hypothetical protein AKJ66_04140, partial [candidate division MSBL1 archaeon SCGC-AAA259E22]